jgi:hypothetical protein
VCDSFGLVFGGDWGVPFKVRTGAEYVDGQHGRDGGLSNRGLDYGERHVANLLRTIKGICVEQRPRNIRPA